MNRHFSKSIYIFIIILVLLNSYNTRAKDRLTPYSITFGGGLNTNLHDASFSSIPGFYSCCPEYTSAFGIGYSFYLGFSYKFDTKLLGMPWKYTGNVSYNNLGAAFSDEEFVGNIISDNTFVKGISEHYIDAGISTVAIDQFITLSPFETIPFGISTGFSVGFLSGKTFSQEERLITPSNSTFENGNKVRGKYSGDITGASTALMALRIGLSYEIYKFGNFIFSPVINFSYSFVNIAESLDWKAHSLFAGVNIEYNIPKAAYDEPKAAPFPKLPGPPKPVPVSLTMQVLSGGTLLSNGSTIDIKRILSRDVLSYNLQPVVFFRKNMAEPEYLKDKTGIEAMQNDPLDGIISYLKTHNSEDLAITAYQTDDESPNVAEKRIDFIKSILTGSGIDVQAIKFSDKTVKEKDLPNPEIADEYHCIRFSIAGENAAVKITETKGIAGEEFEAEPFIVTPSIDNNSDEITFNGKILYDDSEVKLVANRENIVSLHNEFKFNSNQKQLYIQASAENKAGEKDIEYQTVYLDYHDYEGDTIVNRIQNGAIQYYEYFLGFFDYNRSDFMSIDRDIVNKVKQALAEGRKVEFLPLTDNLGSVEHNSKLANLRLNSAYSLVGTKVGITPVFPENYIFPNEHPSGRILNRSVIVRIY